MYLFRQHILFALAIAFFLGCDNTPAPQPEIVDDDFDIPNSSSCSLDRTLLFASLGKDVIPALTDPLLVEAGDIDYLDSSDLVLGIEIEGRAIALPHNIFWHHEVVNLTSGDVSLSVTYCPLTGSGLVFDRSDLGGAEFGVSGLLYKNNLVLYDRRTPESLWPQMARRAKCGPASEIPLFSYPVLETTWSGWKQLHPTTLVVSDRTGHDRDYTRSPYGNYADPNNASLLFDMDIDARRPPKERVLGLPNGEGGLAFPLGMLDDGNEARVVHTTFRSLPVVVFWARSFNTAMAYGIEESARFEVDGNSFKDVETGSRWTIEGRAVDGPMAGQQLRPVANAYIAYWFAWAAFHPDTEVWEGE